VDPLGAFSKRERHVYSSLTESETVRVLVGVESLGGIKIDLHT